MENVKKNKKIIIGYFFVLLLFAFAFTGEISFKNFISEMKNNLYVFAVVLCICLVFVNKINEVIRLSLICLISAVASANNKDYLFFLLPFIMMLFTVKSFADGKNKMLKAEILLLFIITVTEIVFLVILKRKVENLIDYEKIHFIYYSIIILLDLLFIVLTIVYIKRSDLKTYVHKINVLKNKSRISEGNKNVLSEYKRIKTGVAICIFNVCFLLNLLFYSIIIPCNQSEYTLSVLLIIFYLIIFNEKLLSDKLLKFNTLLFKKSE